MSEKNYMPNDLRIKISRVIGYAAEWQGTPAAHLLLEAASWMMQDARQYDDFPALYSEYDAAESFIEQADEAEAESGEPVCPRNMQEPAPKGWDRIEGGLEG